MGFSQPQVAIFFIAFFVLALIEGVFLSRRGSFDWKGLGASSFDHIVRGAFVFLLPATFLGSLFLYVYDHRIWTIPMDRWWRFVLLYVAFDFCYYVLHWTSHKIRWFWLWHSVHHTPRELNWSTGFRLGILERFVGIELFFLVLAWIGFHPFAILAMMAINVHLQLLIHVSWCPKLGWLEYVLVTPSNHRVHHATNEEYLDHNFGGTLIVFDRLFKTYVAEQDQVKPVYGLPNLPASYNPLKIEFGAAYGMLSDMRRSRSLKAAVLMLFVWPRKN